MKKTKTRTIVRCALIASLYTAVSLVLAPSEAFTLLPVLVPDAVVGVTLGCFLTNLVGVFTGANVLGALDIVFGTAATLTAALCTRRLARVRLRGLPVAAAVPPVLINAVVVGAELAWALGRRTFAGFLLQAGGVALGQLFSCFALGLPLVRIIEKTPALRAWFRDCVWDSQWQLWSGIRQRKGDMSPIQEPA